MCGGLIKQDERARPIAIIRQGARAGEDEADQQCFLLARGGITRRRASGPVDDGEIGAMRARQGAPCALIAVTAFGEGLGDQVHDVEQAGALGRSAFGLALQREVALRKKAFRPCIDGGLQRCQDVGTIAGNHRPGFGHAALDRIGPGRVDAATFQQCVAFTHGFLITPGDAAMARDMRHDLAIKEPPPLAGAAAKHAVHVRGQPDDANEVGEVGGRRRGAVETDRAIVAAVAGFQANANLAIFVQRRRNRPARLDPVFDHVGQGSGTQAAARAKLADRFENVGLASPVGAPETNRARVKLQVECRMTAKIGEAEAAKGGH